MIRLINVAHYLSWMDLCKYYSWRELLERGLLTEEEIAALKANRASKKYRMPMVWALEEVAAYAVRKQEALDDWLTTPQEKRVGSKPHVVNEYLMTRIIGIGTEDAVTETSNQAWWIGGYLMVVLSYLSVFDVAIRLREPFGRDAGLDIDPLVYVESTMKNHLAVHELPTMLESEQTCKPAFDMFASLRCASPEEGGGGDFKPPARGPSYVSTYKYPVHPEMREMLQARLPRDDSE
ncbi:hypothetical protein JKP88DRAFT_319207 [Tribonema minus]|uniref:Uncharacterized protein n=1 Tax=Tribonema minus TaxID=303371 RepID=A0A835Z3M1_9STRA|nr:hypothetical protein JKP88DRAFT_319207 [Tribonema minus]